MGWSVVQSKNATSPSAAPSVTLTNTPVTGNKIVVSISGGISVTSVKDGNGNSLTQLANIENPGLANSTWLFAYDVPATPSKNINITMGGTAFGSAVVQEVSGLLAGNTSSMLDGSAGTLAGQLTASSGTAGSATYSSTALSEYLISIFGDWGNSVTATQPTGYTLDAQSVNTSGNADCCVAYKNSTNGSEGSSWALSGNVGTDDWAMVTVAFKLSAGGGSPVLPHPVIINWPQAMWRSAYR